MNKKRIWLLTFTSILCLTGAVLFFGGNPMKVYASDGESRSETSAALESADGISVVTEEDDDPEMDYVRTDAIDSQNKKNLNASLMTIEFEDSDSEEDSDTEEDPDTEENPDTEEEPDTEEDPDTEENPDDEETETTVITYGVDVSKYQGEIDWEKVKASGVSFAIIRVGYRGYSGGSLVEDDYAVANIEAALAAGIEVGVYFFSTALDETEAIEEAKFTLSIIEGYDITYPIVYDCEGYDSTSYRNYGLSNEVRTENAIAFLNYVEAAGYQGMFYGSKNALSDDTSWETSTLEQYYDVWVAQYYYYTSSSQYPDFETILSAEMTTSYTGEYRMWQFSSQGKVDGISGYVDLDLEYTIVSDEESDGEDDTELTSGWVTDSDGKTYYYIDGDVQTGLCTIDGNIYYFTAKGVMWTGWLTVAGSNTTDVIYYFGEDGAAISGWLQSEDGTFYFSTDCKMVTGWNTIDGDTYYFKKTASETIPKGAMYTGLKTISGYRYYFGTDGKMQTGWQTISGSTYYFKKSASETMPKGAMYTGLKTISGYRYYFGTNGKMQTGWQTIDGSTYYFKKSASETMPKGAMYTGLKTISGYRYYFGTNGKMKTGWQTIDGSSYYFKKSASETMPKGAMYIGLKTISGYRYYFGTNGKMRTGWQTINGGVYYFKKTASATFPKGGMYTGKKTIGGYVYDFGTDGRLITS